MFKVEMLDAYEGDALWIEYGSQEEIHRMLIDTGRKDTYREIADRIVGLNSPLDLFVITHIDDDHIFGAVPLLSDGRIEARHFKDIWYNGYTHLDPDNARRPAADVLGPKNGEIFAGLLLQGEFPWNEMFDHGGAVVVEHSNPLPTKTLPGGMKLTLLSPGWKELVALKGFWESKLDGMEPGDAEAALKLFEDRSDLQPDALGTKLDIEGILDHDEEEFDDKPPNGSSIAFLAEYGDQRVLFCGDAHPDVLEAAIQKLLLERGEGPRLRIDALKVSHHGSSKNTSTALLELLDCRDFLISTDGKRHQHPNQEALARIVRRNRDESSPTRLFFNHRSDQTKIWDDEDAKEEWNFETCYPPSGRTLALQDS